MPMLGAATPRRWGWRSEKVKIEDPLQLLGQVDEDVRQALHLDIVGITNDMTLYGFYNSGWKPWTMQSGLEVLVPQDFNTSVNEQGQTFLYPQGDMSVPPAAMMPKDGHFFDNIIRGHIDYDDDDEPSGRADFLTISASTPMSSCAGSRTSVTTIIITPNTDLSAAALWRVWAILPLFPVRRSSIPKAFGILPNLWWRTTPFLIIFTRSLKCRLR